LPRDFAAALKNDQRRDASDAIATGDLLGAFLYEDWCLTARERLRDDFLDALFQLARAALERGAARAKCGAIVRHGPHHAAQKSTTTGISLRLT